MSRRLPVVPCAGIKPSPVVEQPRRAVRRAPLAEAVGRASAAHAGLVARVAVGRARAARVGRANAVAWATRTVRLGRARIRPSATG
jgi:hypothetical protein